MAEASYPDMLSSINGQDVTTIDQTYYKCTNLTTAPTIPSTAESMIGTFQDCVKLKQAPAIPDGVTTLSSAFKNTALTTPPTLPQNITTVSWMLSGCSQLTTAPDISKLNKLESVNGMLENCTKITSVPQLPLNSELQSAANIFSGCTNVVTYMGSTAPDGDFSNYQLPATLTDTYAMFKGCIKLTKAPYLPAKLSNISYMFQGCTSLTGTITIDSQIQYSNYTQCLDGTAQPIIIKGTTSFLNEIAATAKNGNVTIEE